MFKNDPQLLYHPLTQNFIIDQLWKFTSDMKLKNKGGNWQFNETIWTMPAEGSEGNIENKDTEEVLGLIKVKTELVVGFLKVSSLELTLSIIHIKCTLVSLIAVGSGISVEGRIFQLIQLP